MSLVTWTPQQFKQHRPKGNYQSYLRFLATHRGGNTQQPADPYTALIGSAPQPYTPQQIRQQLGQYTQGMPSALTPQQIQAQASSMISPLIQAVTSQIQGQAARASNAVKGYTADLASKLASINFAAPYAQGEQAQAATDSALHSALSGAGSSDAADLAKRLAVINDPSVAAAASQVAGNGTANANANLALGTDAMSNLIANAAAAGSFGQKLPGIAQLGGLQQLAGIGQNATDQIGTQTQQIEAQLPSIIQNLTGTSDTNATNRAQARQQLIQFLSGVNDNRSGDLLKLRENQIARGDAINAGNAKNEAAVQVADTNANAKATAAEIAQANRDRSYRLQLAKTLGYDPVSNKPLPGYKWENGVVGGTIVKTGSGKGGGVPASTYAGLKKQALAKADLFYYGQAPTVNAAGVTTKEGIPGISYGQALKELMRGYSLTRQDAMAILNTYYAPGERGRPNIARQRAARQVQADNAKARAGHDATGLGIQTVP